MDKDSNVEQILKTMPRVSEDATHCSECGKELSSNAVQYVNGLGFCDDSCERVYNHRIDCADGIAAAKEKYLRPLYIDTDIARLGLPKDKSSKVLSWQSFPRSPRGMIIHGATGAGKTRLLTLLLKRLIERNLYGVSEESLEVFYAGELECAIMQSFKKPYEYAGLIDLLSRVKLLVIDDFGKEKFTERYEVSVFNIFERRAAGLRPTIITTNCVGNTLKARFSDMDNFVPFYRRLLEFNETIYLKPIEKEML